MAPARPARALSNCDAGDTSLDGEESNFLAIINDYRASNGLGSLSVSTSLSRAAAWMVHDMGTNGYFGHTDSLGRSPWTRTVDCGYPVAGGENLAAGTNRSSAAAAFELFRNSPAHNENMLVPEYRQIGIARLYVEGSKYGWYWATTFGTQGAAPPQPVTPTPAPTAAPPPPQPAVQRASLAPAPAQAAADPQPRTESAPASVQPEATPEAVHEAPAESDTVAAEAAARQIGLNIALVLHVVHRAPPWREVLQLLGRRTWLARILTLTNLRATLVRP